MTLERYSHVMHLTSQVSGTLRAGLGPIDVLRATLPAGTVSGAPKVRAMEIIDELEPTKRGPYAGVVGYVDFSGNLDTAIAIRTMLVIARTAGPACRPAPASWPTRDPAMEDLECRNKAAALLAAVPGARRITAARRARSTSRGERSFPTAAPPGTGCTGVDRPRGTGQTAAMADAGADYDLLRKGVAAVRWLERDVRAGAGPDAVSFLQGQCSQDWPPWRSGRRRGRSSSNPRARSTPWSG